VRVVGSGAGRAELTHVEPGRYAVTVRARGYAEHREDVDVPAPRGLERTTAELELELSVGASVRGEVVDARREPVAGARVSVGRAVALSAGPAAPPGATDVRGRFLLESLPAGTVRLVASHPALGETAVDVRVRAGDALEGVRIAFPTSLRDAADRMDVAPTLTGVAVELEPGRTTVASVVPGSAADEAGLLPGDVLLRVDGRVVRNAAAAVAALRGPEGTEAALTVRRGAETFDALVRREPLRR
jgi:hypothetical protein